MGGQHRIPIKIGAFNDYLNNTTDYLSTNNNWSRLGLIGTELADWQNFKTAWNLLYPTYSNPATYTSSIKNQIRTIQKNFTSFARPLLNRIAASPAINDDDYLTFNIAKQDTEKTPRGKINDVPIVSVESLPGGSIGFRIRLKEDSTRASMHPLADGVEIKYLIGTTAPANPTVATLSFVSTKAIFKITTDGTKAGQRFWCFVRFVNLTNPANNGDFTAIFSVVIQG